MSTRVLTVADFQAQCTKELLEVEQSGRPITITLSGKAIALVIPAASSFEADIPLSDWLGSGRGTLQYSSDYDAHAPAAEPEDWEALRE